MIFEFIVTALVAIFQALVDAVLPSGAGLTFSIPTGLLSGYSWLNGMAPLSAMVQVGTVYVGVLAALFGLRLLLTLRHTILP